VRPEASRPAVVNPPSRNYLVILSAFLGYLLGLWTVAAVLVLVVKP
jgi:hypothetical protein